MPSQSDSIILKLNDVNFIHGKLHAEIEFTTNNKILLSGDNGAGKTSLLNYLKTNQNLIPVECFFISQNDLPRHEVLTANHLFEILQKSISERVNDTQFKEFISQMNIESLFDQSINSLSGGERQLIKLALSFAIKADFYFIDEPFNNLSSLNREKVRGFLRDKIKGFFIVDHFSKEWREEFDHEYKLTLSDSVLKISEVKNV